jgi:uncharacterized protein
MNFTLETGEGLGLIQQYGAGFVRIEAREYRSSIVVTPGSAITEWPPQSLDDLLDSHMEILIARSPEVIVLGTGRRQRFPASNLTVRILQASIGLEVMDTASACRTYNVLAAEGRNVCAALMMIEA